MNMELQAYRLLLHVSIDFVPSTGRISGITVWEIDATHLTEPWILLSIATNNNNIFIKRYMVP